jgi:hypothetical protein
MSPTNMSTTNNSNTDLLAEIARLKEENAKLAAKKDRKVTFKVGEKGGISVYGINVRFPITLYANQWVKLLGHSEELLAFAEANKDKLATKDGE